MKLCVIHRSPIRHYRSSEDFELKAGIAPLKKAKKKDRYGGRSRDGLREIIEQLLVHQQFQLQHRHLLQLQQLQFR
jgi:hypothetical protein